MAACGIPVLETPVRLMLDETIDRSTRLIIENNAPDYIAGNVIRALNSLDSEQITEDGRQFEEGNHA